MKKIIAALIVLAMLLSASAALAEDGMGVQIIGGPETETEPVSLDDMKLNETVEIEGWGKVTFTAYEVQDKLGYYRTGRNDVYNYDSDYYYSGNEAEFVIIYADIVNVQLKDKNYMESVSVKAIYDDTYEYAGWAYQRNYDNGTDSWTKGVDKSSQNTRWVIDEADQFAISPMYSGHYIYGCTLPNAVIEGNGSLQLIINIDGNEITYNIRK